MRKNTHYLYDESVHNLAIMSGSKRADQLVNNTTLFEACLKQRGRASRGSKTIREFRPIICLNTFYRKAEGFQHML